MYRLLLVSPNIDALPKPYPHKGIESVADVKIQSPKFQVQFCGPYTSTKLDQGTRSPSFGINLC